MGWWIREKVNEWVDGRSCSWVGGKMSRSPTYLVGGGMERDGQHASALLHESFNVRNETDRGDSDFIGAEEKLALLFGQNGEGLHHFAVVVKGLSPVCELRVCGCEYELSRGVCTVRCGGE